MGLARAKRLLVSSQSLGKGGGTFRVAKAKTAVIGNSRTDVRLVASGDAVLIQRKAGKKWRSAGTVPKVTVRWAGTRAAGKMGQAPTSVRVG